jgi:hypothetical protein
LPWRPSFGPEIAGREQRQLSVNFSVIFVNTCQLESVTNVNSPYRELTVDGLFRELTVNHVATAQY